MTKPICVEATGRNEPDVGEYRVDPFVVELKGIAAPVPLMRITARD